VEPEGPQKIWRMRDACWINKATCAKAKTRVREPTSTHALTHTYTQMYVLLIAFYDNSGYVNAPQCYVVRILPVLFYH
jgi:hypothetical protein